MPIIEKNGRDGITRLVFLIYYFNWYFRILFPVFRPCRTRDGGASYLASGLNIPAGEVDIFVLVRENKFLKIT